MAERATAHLRQHKYGHRGVPPECRFYFHAAIGVGTGAVAASLLEAELGRCDRAVLRHHGPRRDFSRWIDHVVHDPGLAATVAAIEATIRPDAPAATVEVGRIRLVCALQARH